MPNSELISVRLSTPFLARTKCVYCGGPPTTYYYARNTTLWNNPRRVTDQLSFVKKFVKRMSSDHYYIGDPKHFKSAAYFSHSVNYKGYRPRLHRTIGSNPVFDATEYLACDCGQARWAFSEKAILGRSEILLRKSRSCFPHKIVY